MVTKGFLCFERKLKIILQRKKKKDILTKNENTLSVLYHSPHRSLPVSPMLCRFSFHCGVRN